MEPQLPFAQLVEEIHQEDITRTHIDRHKLNTNSTLSSSINNLSLDFDHLTVVDIHMMEQDIEHGINVVRHKYSNDPNFKGKPLFLKFCKKNSRSRHSISSCPDKRYTNSLEKPSFQNQTLNQAMKGNQNLPNKHQAQHLHHFTSSGQINPSLLHHFTPLGGPTLTSFYPLWTN